MIASYKQALSYIDTCGPFDERKLREVNRIIGSMMSEQDIQMLLQQAQMIMPTASEPGGMEFIRLSVREQIKTYIDLVGHL